MHPWTRLAAGLPALACLLALAACGDLTRPERGEIVLERVPAGVFLDTMADALAARPAQVPGIIGARLEFSVSATDMSTITRNLNLLTGDLGGLQIDTVSGGEVWVFPGVPAGVGRTLAGKVYATPDTTGVEELLLQASRGNIAVIEGETTDIGTLQFSLPAGVCGVTSQSGGDGVTTNQHEMGSASGTFTFSWDAAGIPDKFQVVYASQTLLDTGFVSGPGTRDLTYAGSSTQITVTVTGDPTTTGTFWSYTVGCPR